MSDGYCVSSGMFKELYMDKIKEKYISYLVKCQESKFKPCKYHKNKCERILIFMADSLFEHNPDLYYVAVRLIDQSKGKK